MEHGMTVDQVLGALWRRKALVGAITVGVFAVGTAFVAALPRVYTATTVVRVEPQRPAAEMVQHTVSEQIEQRLLTVRQELLGRPVLQTVIGELHLYPEIVSSKGLDAAVEQMRKDIDVKVEGENAFELSYSSSEPELAARVANRLPQLYADDALKIRQQQAARATQLFADEMAVLKKSVIEWERKIAQFKVDHLGELPDQMEANMRSLERVADLLRVKSEELRVAEGRRSDLVLAHHAADTEVGKLFAAESELTQALVTARSQWTSDHPEVKRLEGELLTMKQKREQAEGRLWAERQERTRAAALVQQIEKDITGLQKQAEVFQARLDRTPRWTQELAVMQADYEAAKAKYQSVVSRKVEAELAQELELRSARGLFNVISPAGVPSQVARPDRVTGTLIALLLGLALGVLTGIILEMRDDSIRDTAESRQRLPIPVLAVVPAMNGRTERRVLLPAGSSGGGNTVNKAGSTTLN